MSTPSASEIEFSAFVDSAGASLARTATLLTGNRDTAQDLLQEALVRVYLNWHKVLPGAARAYTRRIMGNLATDWWRRGRWEAVGTVPERPGASVTAVVDDDDEFLRHLAGLAPRERAVLVLRFHADLTEREVAEELRLPLGTVKSLSSRALAKLRAKDLINLVEQVMNTSFEESVRARMEGVSPLPVPADLAARSVRLARRLRVLRALALAAGLAMVAVLVLLAWRPPALSAVPGVGVDPMGTPVAAAVIDVSAWPTADFADATGGAACSMSDSGVTCEPFETAVVPPSNACSGAGVVPVLGATASIWSCAEERVAVPATDSPTIDWAKGLGYPVVAANAGGDQWQTLPAGVTLTRGSLSCRAERESITCVMDGRSLVLTASGTTFTGPHQETPTGAVAHPEVSITGVGGLTVGMTAQQAKDAGLMLANPTYGRENRQMSDAFLQGYDGVGVDWALGPTLRGIVIERRTEYLTAEGARIGTSLGRLRELYGSRLVELPRTAANFDDLTLESPLGVGYGNSVPVVREGNRYIAFPILRDATDREPGTKTGVVSEILIGTINSRGQMVVPSY